ncbi:MAG: hypothetical protein Q8T08_18490, partial [Ignavibacteria bacterium]|nr:hypothetical protein [Ignavibacteria bacterium]
LFPFRLFHIQAQLKDILSSLPKEQISAIGNIISPIMRPFLRYTKNISSSTAEDFFQAKDDQQIYELIWELVESAPPFSSVSTKTYVCDISRILIGKNSQKWEKGISRSKKTSEFSIRDLDEDLDDEVLEKQSSTPTKEECSYLKIYEEMTEKADARAYIPKIKKNNVFSDPYTMAPKMQYCENTPGVLSPFDINTLLQQIQIIKQKDIVYGSIANVLVVARLFYGWSDEMVQSLILNNEQIKWTNKTTCWGKIQAETPVGWPKKIVNDIRIENNSDCIKEYKLSYEMPSLNYPIPLHPILSLPLAEVKKHINNVNGIKVATAWRLLNDGLIKIKSPIKLTPARLRLSFQGLGVSYGLDCATRYVITGKILSQFVMPINYTRISVSDSVTTHWYWINQIIEKINYQLNFQNRLNGHQSLPLLESALLPELNPLEKVFAGSWSIPIINHIKKMISFLYFKMQNSGLSDWEKHNVEITYLAIAFCILTLCRPFEFEGLDYFPEIDQNCIVISLRAKSKRGEETFVTKQIPQFLIPLFQKLLNSCRDDYSGGPIWCKRDEKMDRIPFNLQTMVDFYMGQLGMGNLYLRVYGLRHLGRTLHRIFGMSEYFINYKMNHDFLGGEKFNPANEGYRFFSKENQRIMDLLAVEMKFIP